VLTRQQKENKNKVLAEGAEGAEGSPENKDIGKEPVMECPEWVEMSPGAQCVLHFSNNLTQIKMCKKRRGAKGFEGRGVGSNCRPAGSRSTHILVRVSWHMPRIF